MCATRSPSMCVASPPGLANGALSQVRREDAHHLTSGSLPPQALVSGCDACVHLALSAGWDQMRTPAQLQKMLEVSETGTRNVLQACLDRGGVRVVFMSSLAAGPSVPGLCRSRPPSFLGSRLAPTTCPQPLDQRSAARAGRELQQKTGYRIQ